MAQDRIERLHYYQRQYLGAGDFEAQQDYHRCMRRRHNVGPHTQGIVAGLELVEVEQEGGGGGVDVFVLPGLAVDGFGREIVVLAPYRLEGRLFEPFRNQGDRFLPVWIAYDEELTQRPRPGFELCEGEDQFARVRETFRVVVDPVAPFHDDLVVAGHRVEPGVRPDPAEAEDVSTLLAAPRDASVPHQELPDDEDRPRWLVRLGNVHWDGQKLVPDDADPPLLNQDRRYLGAVAEEVLAPQGRLVLRHRWSPEVPPPKDEPEGSDDPDFGVQAELQGSLTVERRVHAKADLVVDGNAGVGTANPDTRLHVDGGVDAALADGTGYLVVGAVAGTNLVLDDDELQARDGGAASALHLQAGGGDLVVHQDQADARVVVKEGGTVGIGVAEPKVKLQVEGGTDAALDDEEAGFLVLGSPAGVNLVLDDNEIMARNAAGESPLHLQADGGDLRIHNNRAGTKVVVRDSGRVGVGTSNPDVKLHVTGGSDASLANGSGYLLLGETSGANLVLDGNEIIARNDGLTSTLHVQAQGGDFHVHSRLDPDRQVVVRDSGRVGIGTPDPRVKLHVEEGTDVDLTDSSGFLVLGPVDGLNLAADNNEIQARNDGATSGLHLQREGGDLRIHDAEAPSRRVVVTGSGRLGVGEPAPQDKLHVAGTARATNFSVVSDLRWKREVATLEPPLARLEALRGVRFEWRRDEFQEMGFDEGEHLGLVAQEVEEVFPELVRTGDDGSKTVDVLGLVPVLLEAVKELAGRVDALERGASGAGEGPETGGGKGVGTGAAKSKEGGKTTGAKSRGGSTRRRHGTSSSPTRDGKE